MADTHKRAPERTEAQPPVQPAPHPQFGPPPVQRQDLGRVEAVTDRSVQRALDQASGLEPRLPRAEVERRADAIISFADQAREARPGDRDYSNQAEQVRDMAQRARESGDNALLERATGMTLALQMGANAQLRADLDGSPDAHALGDSLHRGWGLLAQEGGADRIAYSAAGASSYLDNARIYDAPGNEGAKRQLLDQVGRLTDPSIRMGPEEASQAFLSIQQTFAIASARVSESVALQNVSALLQTLMSSDFVRERMKDQVDKLFGDLASAWKKLSDSEKDEKEKEKELSELEKKTEKVAAEAIKLALQEADAPKELSSAADGAERLLGSKSAVLRSRGQQLLSLGAVFLQNRQLLLADRKLLRKLISAARMVQGGTESKTKTAAAISAFHEALAGAIKAASKEKSEEASALSRLSKAARETFAAIDQMGNRPLREAASRLLASIEEKLRKGEGITGEYIRGAGETIQYLKTSLAALLGLPAGTEKEKKERDDSAGLVAKAVDSAVKDAKSEITALLKFISGLHIGTADPEMKGFLSKLADALSGGKITADEAKSQLSGRFVRDGEAAGEALRAASPNAVSALSSVLRPLKEGKSGLGLLGKAVSALGIARFIKEKVLPHRNEAVRRAALSISGNALWAVSSGNFRAAGEMMDAAARLAGAPEEEAEKEADAYLERLKSGLSRALGELKGEREELLALVRDLPDEIQGRLDSLVSDLDRMVKYLEEAKGDEANASEISEAALSALFVRARLARAMAADIKAAEHPSVKKDLSLAYSAALGVLSSEGEGETFNAVMFAAREIKSGAGLPAYRKGILAKIMELAGAPPEKTEGLRSELIRFLSASLSSRLKAAAGRLDEETGGDLEAIGSALETDVSVPGLERADSAIRVALSMGTLSHIYSGNEERWPGARTIFRRAISAVAGGADPRIIGNHKFLAEKYLSARDERQRADILDLSGRIERDPESMRDAEFFIQVNDQAAILGKQLQMVPESNPLRQKLEPVLGELERLRGLIARGEDLASADELEIRSRQLQDLASTDDTVRGMLQAEADSIIEKSRAEGAELSPDEAMREAVRRSARSAALLGARQRISGLLQVAGSLAKGTPTNESAELTGLSAGALLGGDIEKGYVLASALNTFLSLKDRRAQKEVLEAARGCADGSLPVSAANFIISLHSGGLRERESRIRDGGLLSNEKAYLELAALAARNGDTEGAEYIGGLAATYSVLASLQVSGLDEGQKELREGALSRIEGLLGDYRKTGPAGMKTGGQTPLARTVLGKRGIRDSFGETGFGAMLDSARGLSDTALALTHNEDLDKIAGKDAAEERRMDASWGSERKRLADRAAEFRQKGHIALAGYYESEAGFADRGLVKGMLAEARALLERASLLKARSESLLDEARESEAQADAAERAGNGDEAGALRAKASGLRSESGKSRNEADEAFARVGRMNEGLLLLDRSVREINTIHRENGRRELLAGARIDLALGNGYDCDRNGELILQAAEGAGSPVLLTDERRASLSSLADSLSETGSSEAENQLGIMRTRDAGIMNARKELYDRSLEMAAELILKQSPGVRESELKELLRKKDLDGLGNLVKPVTFTDHDGTVRNAFDLKENEKRYRAVVGMYAAERFGAARALSGSAKFELESGFFIASVDADRSYLVQNLRDSAGPEGGSFAVGSKKLTWERFPSLIRQILAHMPPEVDKKKYVARMLEAMKKGEKEGHAGMMKILDDLEPHMNPFAAGGKTLVGRILDGDLIYFDAEALTAKAVDARRLAFKDGDLDAAETSMDGLRRDAERDRDAQEMDNQRVGFSYSYYEYVDRFANIGSELLPASAEKKLNAAWTPLEPGVDALRAGLKARMDANMEASESAREARDAIMLSGGKMRIDEEVVIELVTNITTSGKPTEKLQEMLAYATAAQDQAERAARFEDLWRKVCEKDPAGVLFAVNVAKKNKTHTEPELAQLDAFARGLHVRSQNFEWDASSEPLARKRFRSAKALAERALSEDDSERKRKLASLAKEAVDGSIAISRNPGWFNSPDRVKSIRENDLRINKEAFSLLFERSDVDRDTRDKLAGEFALKKTNMQLWLSGLRERPDGSLERFRLDIEEIGYSAYTRVGAAYDELLKIEQDLFAMAGKGRESQEMKYLESAEKRIDEFYRAAELVVIPAGWNLKEGELFYHKRRENIWESYDLFKSAQGSRKEMEGYAKAMEEWDASVHFVGNLFKTAGYGVLFALSPVTGGATGWLAGGLAATEGFIGAADYYEACGGDWDKMSSGQAAYFIFQLGMAAGAAVAPVAGTFAEARSAAGTAAGMMETVAGGARAVPSGLEIGVLWGGRAMVAGGLVQTGVSIYEMADAAAEGNMPIEIAIGESILSGLSGGVQPGLHAMRSARARRTGMPQYRSKPLQIAEMLLFGTPLESAHSHRVAYEEAAARNLAAARFSGLSMTDQESFSRHLERRNITSPVRQAELLGRFNDARIADPSTTFQRFESMSASYDNHIKAGGTPGFEGFVKKRNALENAGLEARRKYADEASAEAKKGTTAAAMRRMAAGMEKQAGGLPPGKEGEAAALYLKASAYEKRAALMQQEAGQALRSEFLNSGSDKPSRAGYGPRRMETAIELASAADQLVRGQADFYEAKKRVIENLKTRGIDVNPDEVDSALGRLWQDRAFISAAELAESSHGGERKPAESVMGRKAQLGLALDEAGSISGLEPVVMNPEGRFKVQSERFMNRPFDENDAADRITEFLLDPKSDTGPMYLSLAALKRQPDEVRARVREKVIDGAIEKGRPGSHEDAGDFFDALYENFSEYRPVFELSRASSVDPHGRMKPSPEELSLREGVFARGEGEAILAQGVSRDKGGFSNLINLMLEGEIRAGQFGPLRGGDSANFAGPHGPFYVVVPDGTHDVGGRLGMQNSVTSHVAYVVPSEAHRGQVARALSEGVSKGLLTRAEAASALARTVTYQEFIDAPPGSFKGQKAAEYADSRLEQAESLLSGMDAERAAAEAQALSEEDMVSDAVRREIERRSGTWMVGDEEISPGEQVSTGKILRTIEDIIIRNAMSGEEVDVIAVAGDKRKLNQLNQLFGRDVGDHALDAYREIFGLAIEDAAGQGARFLIRPSQSGDEALGIIIVPKGRGGEVRSRLAESLQSATGRVLSEITAEGHPLSDAAGRLRNPADSVAAMIDISRPVLVRRTVLPGGKITVAALHPDGSDAMATRPGGRREFLTAQVRAAEEEGSAGHAQGLRKKLNTPVKSEIESRTGLIGPDEAVSGIAFELKLAVADPAVLAEMRSLLPLTGKGLHEVAGNTFGIRGLNTFLGHQGANGVVQHIEDAVGAYAERNGLKIRRTGTLKYVIEGGDEANAAGLREFVDAGLSAANLGFRTAEPKLKAVTGANPASIESQMANGHTGLEWTSADYRNADSAISAMGIANDGTIAEVFGIDHGLDAVISVVRAHPEIRNAHDLYTALRDPAIGGAGGAAMERSFTLFITGRGDFFRGNLERLVNMPKSGEAAAQPLGLAAGAEDLVSGKPPGEPSLRAIGAGGESSVPQDAVLVAVALAGPAHQDPRPALRDFAGMSPDGQAQVLSEIRRMAADARTQGRDLINAGRTVEGNAMYDRAVALSERAAHLSELGALAGEAGSRLESMRGLGRGELARIYAESGSLADARRAVSARLGITADHNDNHIFGMLVSGELAALMYDTYPGATSLEMRNIGGGVTGAYLVTVHDGRGAHHEFVKKVDMQADREGALNLRISGIPAPEVFTTSRDGRPLTYALGDGSVSAYGITRSIGEFRTTLRLDGNEIRLGTAEAVSFTEIADSPEMMNLLINEPELFWERFGYTNAGSFAVGAMDGHDSNSFAMRLRVEKPTPENLSSLENAGHRVFRKNDGSCEIFMVGRIDTDDSAGSYWADGQKGNFSFARYRHWMGDQHVLPRLFSRLAWARNMHEMKSVGPWVFEVPSAQADAYRAAGWSLTPREGRLVIETYRLDKAKALDEAGLGSISRPSRPPRFVTPLQLMKQAFGANGDGAFFRGMRKWASEHDNPEYRQAMTGRFRSLEGRPVGASSFHLSIEQRQQLAADGVTYQQNPFNGEGYMPAFSADGRGALMPDYERISGLYGPGAQSPWPDELLALFPQNRAVYVVPNRPGLSGMAGTFNYGGREFAVFPQSNAPWHLSPVAVIRHHNFLRARPGFEAVTGMPTEKMGAVHVFDFIMERGAEGMVSEFMEIQRILEAKEGAAQSAALSGGDPAFLAPRLPPGFGIDSFPRD